MRLALACLITLFPLAALAEEEHADHVSGTADIRVLHAWSNAGAQDMTAIYFDIANEGDAPVHLVGAEGPDGQAGRLAGVALRAGEGPVTIPEFELAPGMEVDFTPETLFVLIEGMTITLSEGDLFDIHLLAEGGVEIPVDVEVLSADATRHPHAGHAH